METRETTNEEGGLEQELSTTLAPRSETSPSTEFVKVEKNLASLGFFTPSSKRLRNAQEKSFTVTTLTDGKRVELKGTILPSAKYGLPITADQDKWIALCKILTDILNREGVVTNPIAFTSADILRLLHKHRHSGKNYREIEEWLDVLFSTTIFSEGIVYLANEKRRVKDRFRVFDRAVSFGKELPDGRVADKNYVWLSDWQLQNINANHLLPIDLEAYREIKNHIAKALVPLLQIWLYATRDEGVFEKRYDELCQILNIQQYRYPSLIMRTLAPSLDELKTAGYLGDWQILKTADQGSYKIVFRHGEKFHRDRRARLSKNPTAAPPLVESTSADLVLRKPSPHGGGELRISKPKSKPERMVTRDHASPDREVDPHVLAEFLKRGIAESHARNILAETVPGQPVLEQLEWGDHQVKLSGGKIANPAGFYVSLVRGNVTPPPTFETEGRRKIREADESRRESERREQTELEAEYYWYCQRESDRFIRTLDPAEIASVLEEKRIQNAAKYTTPSLVESFAEQDMKRELGKRAPVMTLDEFRVNKASNPTLDVVVGDEDEAEISLSPVPTISEGKPQVEMDTDQSLPIPCEHPSDSPEIPTDLATPQLVSASIPEEPSTSPYPDPILPSLESNDAPQATLIVETNLPPDDTPRFDQGPFTVVPVDQSEPRLVTEPPRPPYLQQDPGDSVAL